MKEQLCHLLETVRSIAKLEQYLKTEWGITLKEGALLCLLRDMPCVKAGTLTQLLSLSESNASKVIASAEQKGLIARSCGATDKRQQCFALLPPGLKLLQDIEQADLPWPACAQQAQD